MVHRTIAFLCHLESNASCYQFATVASFGRRTEHDDLGPSECKKCAACLTLTVSYRPKRSAGSRCGCRDARDLGHGRSPVPRAKPSGRTGFNATTAQDQSFFTTTLPME